MTKDYIKENFDDYGLVYDQLKDSLEWREQKYIKPYHHFILQISSERYFESW